MSPYMLLRVQGDTAMAEAIALEPPDEMVRRAREAAHRTGRQMEDVLTEWERTQTRESSHGGRRGRGRDE